MRKTMIYMLTAASAIAITTTQPMTALAASGIYTMVGACQNRAVIGGNHSLQIDGILSKWNLDCDQRPDDQRPGIQKPERPENSEHIGNVGNENNQEDGNENGQESENQDIWGNQVVGLVNEEREKVGLPPLKMSQSVMTAAQIRARELSSKFSHVRPDGSDFSTVLAAEGVSYSGAGENIAYGQESPEAVMRQWMNSAGHRANILNSAFTEIGIGHYQTDSGVHYWTQLFVR